MESPDVDIPAMKMDWISQRQNRGRATQPALRVGRELEDEVMRVTGTLCGAERCSGSRARSAIGNSRRRPI